MYGIAAPPIGIMLDIFRFRWEGFYSCCSCLTVFVEIWSTCELRADCFPRVSPFWRGYICARGVPCWLVQKAWLISADPCVLSTFILFPQAVKFLCGLLHFGFIWSTSSQILNSLLIEWTHIPSSQITMIRICRSQYFSRRRCSSIWNSSGIHFLRQSQSWLVAE